jgi:hypothetical protein
MDDRDQSREQAGIDEQGLRPAAAYSIREAATDGAAVVVLEGELDLAATPLLRARLDEVAGGWLSGRWSAEATPTSPARQRLVARFDMSLPENQRKLEATEALGALAAEAGLSLIELAIAFVVNHPAVTSAIIGPRTIDQLDSQLPAADATLDAALLDHIDDIVRPGVNLNPADTSYGEQVLEPSLRRR